MNTKAHQLNFLDPRQVHFARSDGGLLRVRVDGLGEWPQVKLYRAFPLTHRAQYLSLRDGSDRREPEIGMIEDTDELSAENRALVAAELHARYFIPRITAIHSVTDTYEILEWDVDTDRGRRRFTVKDVHDRIRFIAENHFLIIDTEECRYEIPNLKDLPADQQRLFLRHFFR